MTELVVSLPDLVRQWQLGWGLAKGLAPAAEARGGLHVVLGQPGRHREVVAVRPDEDPDSLRDLAEEVAASADADWLTVPTNRPEEATAVLLAAGLTLLDRPEWLMTTDLAGHPTQAAPEPYAVTTTVAGPVIEAEVRDASGTVAARGTMGVAGTEAVAHNIRTDPEHRRLGLASVVMSALVLRARERGATAGLLIASADGQHLYSALGWVRRATILIARNARAATG
ncbi:GNAT family N-acetyltransferase [Solihabitans fulvus]|uniref:GNAT family N-acetyltransferase n=1 Tax=Solihabitans fulvus TaxID=1892852 RepID=A0A5B2XFR8_9PSEU|nr:GNAT family N-acetyltransferase [Solihabitans fulvus]KAA2261964.1 GNAT family N-acetyltransferase [Solihabitans fulvus]